MRSAFTAFVASALLACSGTSGSPGAGGTDAGPTGSDAGPGSDGGAGTGTGADGIYKSCAPVLLPQTLTNAAQHFTLGYPSTWQAGAGSASNQDIIWRSYSYVPTGSTAPTSAQVNVAAQWGETATSASDVQRMLDDMVSGFPSATVRRFTIGGAPAIAWSYEVPPAQPGCQGCMGDPGPDLIVMGVGAARGLSIYQVYASVRINAATDVFCDVQAIEASLAFTP
jgi:hypothetical protein